MDKFIDPIPNAISKHYDDRKNKFTYKVNNDTVVAPYEGHIYFSQSLQGNMVGTQCPNYIGIGHLVNNKMYFSHFCEVNRESSLSEMQNVTQGQVIGKTGTNDATYRIVDTNNKKQDVREFFSGNVFLSSGQSKEKSSKESTTGDNGNQPKDIGLDKIKIPTINKGKGLLAHKILFYPLTALSKKMQGENYENKKQLMEEIERIKSLLK